MAVKSKCPAAARVLWIAGLVVLWSSLCLAVEWRAGLARTDVTPVKPLWLSGYAARKRPADGTLHRLWAKALAIEDQDGGRVVIVTVDLIGDEFGRVLGDAVGRRVHQSTGIKRRRLILAASHTHYGPVVRVSDGALVTYGLNAQQQVDVNTYAQTLEDKLVKVIEEAHASMRPARLAYGQGEATFGRNRRNPEGPVDHSVPLLRVSDEDEGLLAVLFGYACRAATLGADCYQYSGDYPGFAQIAFEEMRPGSTAMFISGCGGDVNPYPRGTLELAEQHGKSLANAVDQVLTRELHPVKGPLTVAFERVDLPLVDPPTLDELGKRRGEGNVYEQRLTEVLLGRIAAQGTLERACPCPVQVIRFGEDLSLIALSGEVVVDYALRLRKELRSKRIWVAAYCNEVFAYVPSERVLAEGGYEADAAMKYFGIHGPFKSGVEDRIVDVVRELSGDNRRADQGNGRIQ